MAIARRCNRCGRCFDPLNVRGTMMRFENPIFQSADDVRNQKVGRRLIDDENDVCVDLCPDCTERFQNFMNANDELFLKEIEFNKQYADLEQKTIDQEIEIDELREENDMLNALLAVREDDGIDKLLGKVKDLFMKGLREMDPERIKKQVVNGFEHAIFGETKEDKCKHCIGSAEGRCPFGVKPKCDDWKGGNR